jgi:hypothetical protein
MHQYQWHRQQIYQHQPFVLLLQKQVWGGQADCNKGSDILTTQHRVHTYILLNPCCRQHRMLAAQEVPEGALLLQVGVRSTFYYNGSSTVSIAVASSDSLGRCWLLQGYLCSTWCQQKPRLATVRAA